MPPHRFCNFIYKWLIDRAGPERREELEAMLDGPLPGQEERATPAQLEAEGDAFMGMMAVNQQVTGT